MARIIISYRRADAPAMAGRIYDRLTAQYGDDSIFMDIDKIPIGTDFRTVIRNEVRRAHVLLAVIGPRWLGPRDNARNRIEDRADPVRVEIESALEARIPIIPVLVDDGPMPDEAELPDTLKDFAYINAATIDTGRDFRQHMERLVRGIDAIINAAASREAESAPAVQAKAPEPPRPVPSVPAIEPTPVAQAAPAPPPPAADSSQTVRPRRSESLRLGLVAVGLAAVVGVVVLVATSRNETAPSKVTETVPSSQTTPPPTQTSTPTGPPPPVSLKAAHCYPAGGPQDGIVQSIAREVRAAAIEMSVFPSCQLASVAQQWDMLLTGAVDLVLVPDLTASKTAALGAPSLPGIVRSYDRAGRLADSEFMARIKRVMGEAGVVSLADTWVGGGTASGRCVRRPEDAKGLKVRSMVGAFPALWKAAGAIPVALAFSEIYTAMQVGVIDAVDLSVDSFQGLRLAEVAKCVTMPGDNTLWFTYQPLLTTRRVFERMDKRQRDALEVAGKKAQAAYMAAAKSSAADFGKQFASGGRQAVTLTATDFDAWLKVAQGSAYKEFIAATPDGKALIDAAFAVK